MKCSQLISWVSALTFVSASVLAGNLGVPSRLVKRQENTCNRDACLRGVLAPAVSPSAVAFCATYTTGPVSQPTGNPAYFNCGSSPARVSSACSCLNKPSSTTTVATLAPSTSATLFTTSTTIGITSTSITTTTAAATSTSSAIAATSSVPQPNTPSDLGPVTPGCKFGPKARGCWSEEHNINVDPEESWPITGKTVKYLLEITNTTLAPDGIPKPMMVVNGTYPGPTITAQWGDMLEIRVTNKLQHNGTTIHWHGFRQLNSNAEDGTEAVTECPIVPGETRTYTFRATQHGTSWYHSHFGNQYGDGVLGPIVIEGPATTNYDHDLGAMAITDHYYTSMYATSLVSREGRPDNADTGLIKGKNKTPDKTVGTYHMENLFPGKKYRLRLINTGVVNSLAVHLDGHTLTVIAADMVPIVPFETDWLNVHVGQRYDVVFTASSQPGSYWFRAGAPDECSVMNNAEEVKAIFNIGVRPSEPTTTAEYPTNCDDERRVVPFNVHGVPRDQFTVSGDNNLTSTLDEARLNVWTINGTGIRLDPANPTLEYILNNDTSYRSKPALTVYELPTPDVWQFLLIQNTYELAHPLHLHGHDARVLGSSYGAAVFTEADVAGLEFDNPIRRDTYMLPGLGWIVIAFKTDNPGAWIFHCHIVWHTPEGMAIQFLERPAEIKQKMSLETLGQECASWDTWFKTSLHPLEPPNPFGEEHD